MVLCNSPKIAGDDISCDRCKGEIKKGEYYYFLPTAEYEDERFYCCGDECGIEVSGGLLFDTYTLRYPFGL